MHQAHNTNNSIRIKNSLGAMLFIAFFIYSGWQFISFDFQIIFIFRALKSLCIAILFLIRKPPIILDSLIARIMSYISIFTPFIYQNDPEFGLWINLPVALVIGIFIAGECLSIIGIVTLGTSFGISPAKRTLVDYGLYRFIKHPIYSGYAITELAILAAYPSKFNLGCFIVSMSLYVLRAWREEAILQRQ